MVQSLHRPVCFVLTPFGVKIHPDSGASVDLDQDVAGLKEGSVQERVIGAEFTVADVTTRDPAILFLLGARAERMPGTTLVLAARGSETQLANWSAIRVVVYDLDEGNRLSSRESMRLRKALFGKPGANGRPRTPLRRNDPCGVWRLQRPLRPPATKGT